MNKYEPVKNTNDLVENMLDQMHSYRDLKVSDEQRASMKTILKVYLDAQTNYSKNDN